MGGELKRYLQKATKGLWGRKKIEVWQELEANISLRIEELRIQGLGHEQAVRRALCEMGEPQEVSMGMLRIYTLPRVTLGLFFAILITGVSLVWLTQARAQAETNIYGASIVNPLNDDLAASNPYFEVNFLVAVLLRAGIEVEATGTNLKIGFPQVSPVLINTQTINTTGPGNTEKSVKTVQLLDLIFKLENVGVNAKLEGWAQGRLVLGKTQLTLWNSPPGNAAQSESGLGYTMYGALLQHSVQGIFRDPYTATRSSTNSGCRHVFSVKDAPGQIYALVSAVPTWVSQSSGNPRYRKNLFDVAVVNASGRLDFRLPANKLQFTTDLDRVKPGTYSAEPVALMKVTGEFKYGNLVLQPVLPTQPTSERIPGTCM